MRPTPGRGKERRIRRAVHFIGFCGDEYWSAVRVFGPPDFVHIGWDRWASQEVMDGDVAVFARGTFDDEPSEYSFPDLRETPDVVDLSCECLGSAEAEQR